MAKTTFNFGHVDERKRNENEKKNDDDDDDDEEEEEEEEKGAPNSTEMKSYRRPIVGTTATNGVREENRSKVRSTFPNDPTDRQAQFANESNQRKTG